jgi:hypothetical protein
MVRELCALFQLLRENSRKISSHAAKVRRPEKYIVDFYDAFRYITLTNQLQCFPTKSHSL